MSTTTIKGLRFRRVLISGSAFRTAKKDTVCDALICQRCTAVLIDSPQAERHVCMPAYWMCGASIEDVETVPVPQKPRERVRIANDAHMTNLWPHGMRVPKPRASATLVERYETLSVLVAELAAMERALEARAKRKPRRRS